MRYEVSMGLTRPEMSYIIEAGSPAEAEMVARRLHAIEDPKREPKKVTVREAADRGQVTQETGLRAQMTERMERAETAVDVLKDKLRVALHDIEAVARESNDTIMRLRLEARDTIAEIRAKSKQQLADSLNAENAMLARLKKTENELAHALTAKHTAFARCGVLQRERDEARAEAEALAPLRIDVANLRRELKSRNPLPGSR